MQRCKALPKHQDNRTCSRYDGVSLKPSPEPDCRDTITESSRSSSSSENGSSGPSTSSMNAELDSVPVEFEVFAFESVDSVVSALGSPPTRCNPFGSLLRLNVPSDGSCHSSDCEIGLWVSSSM